MSTDAIDERPPSQQEYSLASSIQQSSRAIDRQVDDNDQSVPEGKLLPPANFRPFFTLVEDTLSGEHYHPAVHYIFSDDDQDTLTSSILDTLQTESEDPNHRLVLLNVTADGKTIKSAHSLSSAWQVSQASITSAPSWTDTGSATAREGLMLKVEGSEAKRQPGKDKITEEPEDILQRVEVNVETFTERLKHLQDVMSKSSML